METAIDAEEAPPAPRPPSAQQVQERGSAGASTSSADLAIAAGQALRAGSFSLPCCSSLMCHRGSMCCGQTLTC